MPPLSSSSSVSPTDTVSHKMVKTTNAVSIVQPEDEAKEECSEVEIKSTELNDTADGKTSLDSPGPMQIVWKNVIQYGSLHAASLYGAYLMFTSAMWQTNIFALFLSVAATIGVTAGVHRLWSHRSYKASLSLRILLAFLYTIAGQDDIYKWARNHRVHHKYSETNADPHNAKRGFFFAHIGWLMCRKHPEVIRRGKAIDLSDLMADPVVRFHRRYYSVLALIFIFLMPTIIPMYLWGETFSNSFYVATLLRLCFSLNQAFMVNSVAHMWGAKPYDVHINPSDNYFVVLGTLGEGFHNYHHTFPYDYATSEYGIKYNMITAFIDLMAFVGLAYDRKTAPKKIVSARILRTGKDSLHNLQTANLQELSAIPIKEE